MLVCLSELVLGAPLAFFLRQAARPSITRGMILSHSGPLRRLGRQAQERINKQGVHLFASDLGEVMLADLEKDINFLGSWKETGE